MVETSKQVRVDNWGIYFLQRLQLFFSKTDYCDLTLQFEGNVQLKVHRLVMNACTEYFAFLEQTCPALEENTILMPSDLQADVIVPIVNFMYTGMLEFHPSIFEKLYKAAETMNIAVLTKLLEAQLHRFKVKPKKDVPHSWGAKKTQKSQPPPVPVTNELPSPLPGKKLPFWRKRQNMQPVSHPVSATFSNTKWNSDPPEKDPLHVVDNTPKPTRFEWPDDDQPPFSVDPSFDDVSLTSKPLWTKEDDHKVGPTFEEARAIAQRSRQSSKNNSLSQDNEEFVQKEQKVNAVHLDEIEVPCESALKRKADTKVASSPKRVKITNQDDETIISIKTNNPNDLDHTKIVSEILKRYPDLVKSKKNIKLKITATKNEPTQIKLQTVRERAKAEATTSEKPSPAKKEVKMEPVVHKESGYGNTYKKKTQQKADFRAVSEDGPWTCMECLGDGEAPEFVLYYLFRKHMTDVHHMEFDTSLCKYCGRRCPSDRDMAYHLYTKHGLRPPSNINFPKCMMCPFIGVSTEKLQEHIKTHKKEEEQCVNCKLGFESGKELLNHQQMIGHHSRTALSILDCGYCPKKLQSPVTLFTHIRTQHMKEARRDGITSLEEFMDIPDDRFNAKQNETETALPQKTKEVVTNKIEEKQQQVLKERVNIISNVKVATKPEETVPGNNIRNSVVEQEITQPVTVATTTAATLGNIGGSLATNLGLVDIVVLDDNQQYILQQPEGQGGNTEFILPELSGNEGILQAATAAADLNSTDELVMVLTDHDYQDEQNQEQSDNSNIVVLYSHPVEGQQGQFITSQGNLLVNSEGLIEIRNGAGITTTAGQILVNSNSTTTTTQAIESPIESIELIRKEIEGEVETEVPRGNVRAVLRKKVLEKDLNKIDKRVAQVKTNSVASTKEILETSLENGESGSDQLLDTTDSSIQEEPMEVEEIGPQERESVETGIGEENNQLLDDLAEKDEAEPVLPTISETPSEELGEDVPPVTQNTAEENSETPKGLEVYTSSETVILNDPNEYNNSFGNESEKTDQSAPDEPMEVDGAKLNESTEEIEGKDEVNGNMIGPEEKEFDGGDNQMEESLDQNLAQPQPELEAKASQPDIHQDEENDDSSKPPIENNEEQVTDDNPDEETSNQDDPESVSKEDQDQAPVMENDQVPAMENDQAPVMENDHGSVMGNCHGPVMENDQVPVMENDHIAENDQNDQNDQNDNVQPNFDDFTDESQQSSGQKVHRDLNKEILDDWDDTDSQQSQSHERDSQEDAQEQAALNAAENVNKLMDDWDEEDEDQSKE